MKRDSTVRHELTHMAAAEIDQVSGGIEKEGIRPRKPGDTDYAVYVDGVYMGTVYAGPGDTITGTRTDPLIHL
jgi:hypothetical protein